MALPVIMVVLGALLVYSAVKGKHPVKVVRETLIYKESLDAIKDERKASSGGGRSLKGGRI